MNRFISLFHKGEQIFVGFRDGWTHGFVSEIRESGFSIYQINNPTEYCYDWEHFEIVCHPGIRVSKTSGLELAELFEIQEKSYTPPWEQPLTREPFIRSNELSSQIITFPLDLPFELDEIEKVSTPKKDYLIHEQKYQDARSGKFKTISIKVGKGEGEFHVVKSKHEISVIQGEELSQLNRFSPLSLDSHYDENCKEIKHSIKLKRDGYLDKYIWDKKSLKDARSKEWVKRPIYTGDPWRICDTIPIDLYTRESKQGLLMVNAKASMWLGIIL